MESNSLKKVVRDIKSLKIQGASKVRKAIVSAVLDSARKSKAKDSSKFITELKEKSKILLGARPTEPEAQTGVRILLSGLDKRKSLEENKKEILRIGKEYEKDREKILKKIAEIGAKAIPSDCVVMTYCHSHTVEEILIKAKSKIKYVLVPETRPRFQGRITAKVLAKAGLKVKFFVDSAYSVYAKDADIFITGADSVLMNGDVINKIGTKAVSEYMHKLDIPHYVCVSSQKLDLESYLGKLTKIEERNPDEVWKIRDKKIKVMNPAFDLIESGNVSAVISDLGFLSPDVFVEKAFEKYKGVLNG